MIFAMHQIEVACLLRHALHLPFFSRYLAGLADAPVADCIGDVRDWHGRRPTP